MQFQCQLTLPVSATKLNIFVVYSVEYIISHTMFLSSLTAILPNLLSYVLEIPTVVSRFSFKKIFSFLQGRNGQVTFNLAQLFFPIEGNVVNCIILIITL